MKKTYLLWFALWALLLIGCRQDHFPEAESYNNNGKFRLTKKTVSLDKAQHKNAISTLMAETEAKIKTRSSHTGKSSADEDLSLDTENIIYMENGSNYHTYTFRVISQDPSADVQNLVMSPLTDGSYERFLVTYHLTEAEKTAISQDQYVDIAGKINIVYLENDQIPTETNNSMGCKWVEVTHIHACSSNEHGEWNIEEWGECEASTKPYVYTTMVYQCTEQEDPQSPGGGGGGGTGGGGGSDTPPATSNPCNGGSGGVNDQPQSPNTTGRQNCGGVPTTINIVKETDPCTKTKAIYNNTAVKSRYDVLKQHTSDANETGYGFRTVSDGNGGTTTQTTPLNPDAVNPDKMKVAIFPTSYGYAHTHLDKANGKMSVKIFSPADINTFIAFLKNAKANGTPLGDIFGGMLASDPDTNYNIYQMQYTGTGNDLPADDFTKEQLDALRIDYRAMAQEILNNNDGVLSHSDMQRLFFKFLKKMNLKNVVLSKIENDVNKTKIINFDTDGNPTEQSCPQ